ncbi:MAG: hypothetical protein M3O15_07815 [Acidobacteriota bacterium]|nr:hypothetical protein [Acidobacteriota bacterium]
MKKTLKLAAAAAILAASLLGATREATACLRVCTLLCSPGLHCVIVNGCARCVPIVPG